MSDLEGLMHGAGIYHMFDKDGSGKVEWNELMQELDTNGDGQISLQEFLDGWQKKIDGLKVNQNVMSAASVAQEATVGATAGNGDSNTVILMKEDGVKLGFNVKKPENGEGGIIISEVIAGSPSDGKLKVGDIISHINETNVTNGKLKGAKNAIKDSSVLRFTIIGNIGSGAGGAEAKSSKSSEGAGKPTAAASAADLSPEMKAIAEKLKALFSSADQTGGTSGKVVVDEVS